MHIRSRTRYWAKFVLAALLLQLLLFLGLRQPFLDIFRNEISVSTGASSPQASFPDAIVAIEIEIEGDEPAPVEEPTEQSSERPPTPQETPNRTGRGDSRIASIDILEITGEAQEPIPSQPSGNTLAVPPRPVEITWPETKDLGHCLDLQVSIIIRVSATGDVLSAEPAEGDFPHDCVRAALEAARRIRFIPGRVDGKAAEMTTRVRIDFRRKK